MSEQLDVATLRPILADLVRDLKAKRRRLTGVVEHLRMKAKTFAPRGQTAEHRYLDALTHTPWGWKIATTYAQELCISGFRTPDSDPMVNDPAWEVWDDARMAIMQDILIREALEYGESFCAALSGAFGRAVAKPLPPMHTVATYDDPVVDVWPKAVLSTVADRKTAQAVTGTLYVGDWVYNLMFPDGLDADTAKFTDAWQHASVQTPVVRLFDEIDSQGVATGKIEPLLPLLERIRKDTYDRQLIQHKSSWKVRTATGLEPNDGESTEQTKMRMSVEDILVSSDPQTKFGTLDETPLDSLIKGKEADVYELCSLAQIPPTALMPGNIANIAAEAIAELRSGFENRIADHKEVLGDSFRWLVQALSVQAGVEADPRARCQWQDRSVRSLAQAADAWSKLVPSLGIPVEPIWSKIPGVTQGEVAQWANYAKRAQGRATLEAIFKAPPQPATAAENQAGP